MIIESNKIFNTYDDIWDYKGELFIMVNNDYVLSKKSNIDPISNITFDIIDDIQYSRDFLDNNNPDMLLYMSFRRRQGFKHEKEPVTCTTYIFKKNKLYKFNQIVNWYDEVGNVINSYNDIYYDPFLFVKVEDEEKAIRKIKIDKLENNI